MDQRIERQEHLPAAPDAVWRALTGADARAAWLGEGELTAEAGREGVLRLEGVPHHVLVEVADPPRRLALRWWPMDTGAGVGPASAVEFRLEPIPAGTRLTVVEEPCSRPLGFRALAGAA